MIPSYNEELRVRKGKDRIFWVIVFIMTIFLYFFFQGYYPDYERLLGLKTQDISKNISKETFMKPFGIIDMHVLPTPDKILINNEPYGNNSKTIFDLGEYIVSITKSGYLPITFPFSISPSNRFYTNTVNLFRLPTYETAPFIFKNIFPGNDFSLVESQNPGEFWITDSSWKILEKIKTPYVHVGGLYFTDRVNIFSYSLDTKKFIPLLSQGTKLPILCTKVSYYDGKLFCHDTMQFIGPRTQDIQEKILAINDQIITTSRYIYNQKTTNQNWKYFEYQSGSLSNPGALVRINEIPYVFEKGIFSSLVPSLSGALIFPRDYGFDSIYSVQEFSPELVFIGHKDKKGEFLVMEGTKRYFGEFDTEDVSKMKVQKLNGAYIFYTDHEVYIYYKGAKEITKILSRADNVILVDSQIFFNREGKSYLIDLLRKEK